MTGAYDEMYGVPATPQQAQQPQPAAQPQVAAAQQAAQAAPQPVVQQPAPQAAPQQPIQPFGQEGGLPAYHVHHSYIWLGTIRSMLAVLFVLLVTSFSSVAGVIDEIGYSGLGMLSVVLGGVGVLFLVVVGLVVLVHVLAYRRLYFTLGPNNQDLYSGILKNNRVHVHYRSD